MEYKITLKNNIKAFQTAIIYNVLFAIAYFYCINYLDNSYGAYSLVLGIHYAVAMIPTFFLHGEYYLRNKHCIIDIDRAQKKVVLNGNKAILFDQIEKVTLFMPHVWQENNSIKIWPFQNYRYAIIKLRTGDTYIFTCLMGFQIDKVMSSIYGVPIEIKKRLIATTLIN